MACDDVCKASHILHDGDGNKCLGRNLVREFHPFLELACDAMDKCLDIPPLRLVPRLLDLMHICLGISIALPNGKDLCALLSVDKNAQNPLGHAKKLPYLRNSTNAIEIVRRRVIAFRIPLRHNEDLAVPRNRALNGGNRAVTPDIEVDHHVRVDHQATQWEERERSFFGHRISFRLCKGSIPV